MNGRLEVVSIRIDPELVADGDTELLEDLVTAAVNAGLSGAKARDTATRSLALAGGMPLGFPMAAWIPARPLGGRDDDGRFGRGRPADFGLRPLARNRRQVGRATGSPSARVLRRRLSSWPRRFGRPSRQIRHCQICFHLTEANQSRLCDLP